MSPNSTVVFGAQGLYYSFRVQAPNSPPPSGVSYEDAESQILVNMQLPAEIQNFVQKDLELRNRMAAKAFTVSYRRARYLAVEGTRHMVECGYGVTK